MQTARAGAGRATGAQTETVRYRHALTRATVQLRQPVVSRFIP